MVSWVKFEGKLFSDPKCSGPVIQTLPLKGRVSRFSACASDDLSAVKIIVFRPIRSAFTTLAGYGGKLLKLVVDNIWNDKPSTTAASC